MFTAEEFDNVSGLDYEVACQEIELQREQSERLVLVQTESDAYIQYLNGDDYWDHQNKL